MHGLMLSSTEAHNR